MNWLTCVLLLVAGSQAYAHQPVMDMAPRWADGYGVQARIENFDSQTIVWTEGIYTFDKSVRATFKLPHADGEFGGLILGLPLKKYSNDGSKTSNWSITPSVQLPTGTQDDWDAGLSLSYSSESPKYYQLYDLYSWGDRTGLDINVGLALPGKGSGKFLMWDVSLLTSDKGDRVQSGPVFVYFRKNMMFRAEYKALVYERDSDWSGGYINVGIGFVY
jgi:hypothetical protein